MSGIVKAEHTDNTYQTLNDKIKLLDDKIKKYENNKIVNKLYHFIYDNKFTIFNLIILFINIYFSYYNIEYFKAKHYFTDDKNVYNLETMGSLNLRVGQDQSVHGICLVNDKSYFLWKYSDKFKSLHNIL
jgi:hypothetical protein